MDGTILGKKYDIINGGGGGGGTSDYEQLSNLPKINSVELKGNKSLTDLGIQAKLTFDNTPTENSNNPVTSGGVYSALSRNVPVKMSVNVTTVSSGGYDATINVSISFNGVLVSSTDIVYTIFNDIDFIPVGDFLRISYSGTEFKLSLLKDSLTHSAGYVNTWEYGDTVNLTEECYIINGITITTPPNARKKVAKKK